MNESQNILNGILSSVADAHQDCVKWEMFGVTIGNYYRTMCVILGNARYIM